jgi:phosphate-selective porin OprO/OprP
MPIRRAPPRAWPFALVLIASASRAVAQAPDRAREEPVPEPSPGEPVGIPALHGEDPAPHGDAPTDHGPPAAADPTAPEPSTMAPPAPVPGLEQVGSVEAPAEAPEPAPERPPTVQLEWGRGLTVRSDDGAFTLQVRGRVQAQAAFGSAPPGVAEPDIQFLIRRARLAFRGNLAMPTLQYYVQLSFAPRDMEPGLPIPLRDARLTWQVHRDLEIRIGQMKVPFNRQRVLSSSTLQLVDRSIVNAELTLDRDIGIYLRSTDLFGLGGILEYQLGVFGGEGRLRLNDGTGLLYVARAEVQPLGEFEDDYSEADLSREERPRLSIGAGIGWNDDSQRVRGTTGDFFQLGGFDYLSFEVDVMFKFAGFSLLCELIYREATGLQERVGELDGVMVTERARNGIGWMVQAGYLFSREVPFELAARFADIHPVGAVTAIRPQREMTLGMSYYFIGHSLKVQLDYGYLHFERFEDGVHRVRLQTQAFF